MEYTKMDWNGFYALKFDFLGFDATIVMPNCTPNGKWALKTEYFSAFPQTQIELLNRGWHVAYLKNDNRWAQEGDLARKLDFIRFISSEFGLNEKCALIGMSCGGLFATMLAARAPELIDVLYLDAPVLNLLSCPCDMGIAQSGLFEEFHHITGLTKSDMLAYRNHPIDHIPTLLEKDIPVVLVAGDCDRTVPYCENGAILEAEYRRGSGRLEVFLKKGCDHHPHGLDDPKITVDAIERFSCYQKGE